MVTPALKILAPEARAASKPDFEKLRADRDAALAKVIRETVIELGGDPDKDEYTVHVCGGRGCYCACPNGPCEHEFDGWREFDDGLGGEQFCAKCGTGAMSHSMRTGA